MEDEEIRVQVKEVSKVVWYALCPKCGREICGNYKDQAIRNLKTHLKKHERDESKRGK